MIEKVESIHVPGIGIKTSMENVSDKHLEDFRRSITKAIVQEQERRRRAHKKTRKKRPFSLLRFFRILGKAINEEIAECRAIAYGTDTPAAEVPVIGLLEERVNG